MNRLSVLFRLAHPLIANACLSLAFSSEPGLSDNSSPPTRPPALRIKRNVTVHHVDGQDIVADLYRPVGDEKLPGVFMIHGGGWVGGDKWNVAEHAAEMAESGFVVMAINYRLSPAVKWPAHLLDCRKGLAWMGEHSLEWHIDTERIGTWGYSAGAQLSLLLALNPSPELPKVSACVAGGAPCDLGFVPETSRVLSAVFGGSRAALPEVYRDASPIHFISAEDPPLFFFHGTNDLLVPIENSRAAHEKAKATGLAGEFLEVPELGHLLTFVNKDARRKAIGFLQKHLK